jgi:hypothetical protein
MSEFKTFAIRCALLLTGSVTLTAGERIDCKSPDGKFALRETFNELNPIHGDSAIIESGTRKVAVQLHGDEPAGRSWFGRRIRGASPAFATIGRTERPEFFFVTDRCSMKSKCRSYRRRSCQTFQNQMGRTAKRSGAWNRFAGWSQAICF